MASVRKRTWTHNGAQKEAWVVAYTDIAGKRRLKTFDKKKDADKYRTKVETEVSSGQHVPSSVAQTVKQVCEAYLRLSEGRMKSGAIGKGHHHNACNAVDHHIVPYIGQEPFADLTSLKIEQWVTRVQSSGNRRIQGAPLSGSALKTVLHTMKRVEAYALKHGLAARKIVGQAAKEIGNLPTKPIRTFTVDELRSLAEANERGAQGKPPRDVAKMRCYIQLAAVCGLRLGEIHAIRPKDINFERSTIHVRQSLTVYGDIKGPKTKAGIRDVPMPATLQSTLRNWIDRYMVINEHGLVFTTTTGTIADRGTFNSSWRRVLKAAGLDEGASLHFHALRHFAASVMIQQQIPLPDVARLLGHESFDMTLQVYAHPTRELSHHHAAFERMTGLIDVAQRIPRGPKMIEGTAIS